MKTLTLEERARRAASRYVLRELESSLVIYSVDQIRADFYQICGTAVIEIGNSFPICLNVTLYEKDSRVEMI